MTSQVGVPNDFVLVVGYDRFKQLYDVQKTHGQLQQVYADLLQGGRTPVEAKAGLQSDLSKNF